MQPQISVIIPIYNGEAELPELLTCLAAQTYDLDRVEYLIIDNGSTDRTWELLQASDLPNLRALQETTIQSSYAARNTGIRAAKAEILAFTDADCRPQPDWLMNLVAPFVNAAMGLVIGEIKALAGDSLWERYADKQNILSQKYTIEHRFCPYGQTANIAMRKVVFNQVGLFRPYLTTGGDADMCWRILRGSDWQWAFVESAIVCHHHRDSLKALLAQWRRYGTSNRYLHDLHGIALMSSSPAHYYAYRLARWLFKELPQSLRSTPWDRAELLKTPIGLLCLKARFQGQSQAQLPECAREIPLDLMTPNERLPLVEPFCPRHPEQLLH